VERTLAGLAASLLAAACVGQSLPATTVKPVAGAPAPSLTFAHDIAPIVYSHCASCHRPGESGPFPLLTFDEVKKHASQIVTVTQNRYMPPWLPEAGHGDFIDENHLTPEQIRKIADWVSQGAPEGEKAEIPPLPKFTDGWQLGPPDLIVEAPEAFTLQADGTDVYHNFVLSPKIDRRRFVRAIEVRPGDGPDVKRIVHHANVILDRSGWGHEQEPSPGAGFPGMELTNRRSVFDDDGYFLFWRPGGTPDVEPDGLAWTLDPGNDLIVNTHMRPSGKPEQIRPMVGLYFTDKPQTKFRMLIQLEHDGAINIAPGVRDFPVSDDFRLPMDVDALAVFAHAHYLATLMEAYATLPDGTRKWLIRIPSWDQSWQSVYRYREPVFLPKGTLISMRYHYDNSAANVRNPNHPPKRVQAGNHATDEMGHLWLQVLPRDAAHQRELVEALSRHTLEKYPDDFPAHMVLGAVLLSRANAQAAVPVAQAAVRIQPKDAEARNLLGATLAAVGRVPEAIVQYREAVALSPDSINARYNLAIALAKAGRYDEAIAEYQRILAVYPNEAEVKRRLEEAQRARRAQPDR
jgi:Tfp pilus assembly protein PilF/mono/diheme cytochrome c family protein